VISKITITTPSAANSSVLDRALNSLALSAAYPSRPVTWVTMPSAPAAAAARIEPTGPIAPFQPCVPTLTGTMICIAVPSADTTGPATWPGTTPGSAANRRASAAALARSAVVSPEGR
jgi:hypothetical protein